MARQYNEDLFEHTKMTFGEHLDELRQALIKSILALVVGVIFGLSVANLVVRYVQTPLITALQDYYSHLEEKKFRHYLELQQKNGQPVPHDLDAAAKVFAKRRLIMDERFIDPLDVAKLMEDVAPSAIDKSALPQRPPDYVVDMKDLVPFRTYHRVEDDPRVRVIGLQMEEPFVVWVKAGLLVGALLASPFIFYFIWQFVAAGLYPHEQWYVKIFMPFSIGLFMAGAALAFFVVFKFMLAFFLSFYDWIGNEPDARISDFLWLVMILPLGFGISFQLPLVMLFLERIGVFTIATYLSSWRISVLIISAIAMVLTPSDPYSMTLMAAPLVALYFFGILLCKWMPKRTSPFGQAIE